MDKFYGTNSGDQIIAPNGTTNDSKFYALDGNDTVWGGEGNDDIYGGNGKDILKGGGGHDVLYGNAGDDTLVGNAGDDTLYGGFGNDSLIGEGGQDHLNGGLGADSMYGGAGNDIYIVDNSEDKVIEKSTGPLGSTSTGGTDTVFSSVDYSINGDKEGASGFDIENLTLTGTASYAIGNSIANTIKGNDSNNTLLGLGGNDYLRGERGDDGLYGGKGTDTLLGGSGNDHLYGQDGNDDLSGGPGNDILTGGSGGDRLFGGSGADTSDFNSVVDSLPGWLSNDRIIDFDSREGDKIDLSTIDANLYLPGNQEFEEHQLSYYSAIELLTADIAGGGKLDIVIVGGASNKFDLDHDVIA